MTLKRKLQERIKTIKEIQAEYSPSTAFYKNLEKHRESYQEQLDKEVKAKSRVAAAKKKKK